MATKRPEAPPVLTDLYQIQPPEDVSCAVEGMEPAMDLLDAAFLSGLIAHLTCAPPFADDDNGKRLAKNWASPAEHLVAACCEEARLFRHIEDDIALAAELLKDYDSEHGRAEDALNKSLDALSALRGTPLGERAEELFEELIVKLRSWKEDLATPDSRVQLAMVKGFRDNAVQRYLGVRRMPATKWRAAFMQRWTLRFADAGMPDVPSAALAAAQILDRVWNRNQSSRDSWDLLKALEQELREIQLKLPKHVTANSSGYLPSPEVAELQARQKHLKAALRELKRVTPGLKSAEVFVSKERHERRKAASESAAADLSGVLPPRPKARAK